MNSTILLVLGVVAAIGGFSALIYALQKSARTTALERERRRNLEGGQDRVAAFLGAVAESPPSDANELAARFRLLGK